MESRRVVLQIAASLQGTHFQIDVDAATVRCGNKTYVNLNIYTSNTLRPKFPLTNMTSLDLAFKARQMVLSNRPARLYRSIIRYDSNGPKHGILSHFLMARIIEIPSVQNSITDQ
jgi:hypothetical protein